jgi:5-methylcytosine-specific restriction endonuclease McrA
MGVKQPNTPRSRVRSALRRLWLTSRERAAALKRDKYTCQRCGVKQSKRVGQEQLVEVHHIQGILWENLIDDIYTKLLVGPEGLETLCPECHSKENA